MIYKKAARPHEDAKIRMLKAMRPLESFGNGWRANKNVMQRAAKHLARHK
jgi:hypothetical protein